jgi:hypothetical protein
MISWSLLMIDPHEYTTLGTYPSRSSGFGINNGSSNRPISTVGSSSCNKLAPRQYRRIGPTAWVMINQPSAVSIGDPQLPICTNSQLYTGSCSFIGFSPYVNFIRIHDVVIHSINSGKHGIFAIYFPWK